MSRREALVSEQVVARQFDSEFECADATEDYKQVERLAKASTLRSRRSDKNSTTPIAN